MATRRRAPKSRGMENKSFIVVRMIPGWSTIEKSVAPTKSSINYESFKQSVDFQSEDKWPCTSSWERDVRSDYIPNKEIKDLPFAFPRCCTDLFNNMRDKKNARKLRSYNLDKAVRPIVRGFAVEEYRGDCISHEDVPCLTVPECYIPEHDSCDSSDEEKVLPAPARNESDCSGCSTLGTGFKKVLRREEKVDFREILQRKPVDPCEKLRGTVKRLKRHDSSETEKPCRTKSYSSERHKPQSCSHKTRPRKTCLQLIGTDFQTDLECSTVTSKIDPTESDSYFKLPKLKRSETDFLNDLNKFIDRELELRYAVKGKLVGPEGERVSRDIKMKVFREAFHIVRQSMPSFRHVLSRIQTAYDEAIEWRDKMLQESDVMKSALLKMQKDVESQKAAIWEDSMARVVTLLHEKLDLIGVIDSVNEDKEEMKQTIEGLSKELERNHSRLMEEMDARRLVTYEYTELTAQIEILREKAKASAQKPEKASNTDEANDPVVLQMALAKSREALAKAQAKICYMETVYDTVCPLRDYEALLAKYRELEKTNSRLTYQIRTLEKQVTGLERRLDEVIVERDQIMMKINKLQASGTPRLNWEKCAQFVTGGLEAWEAMTVGKKSQEKFDMFLDQVAKPQQFGENWFVGRGKDPEVPPYLKFEGRFCNRRYWLRDVHVIINDIWRAKVTSHNRQPMATYLMEYAENIYPVALLRGEFIYNLVAGCKRYSYDPQVKLFYGVLNGECDEDVYRAMYFDMDNLKQEMRNKSAELRSKNLLTGAAFCEVIRQSFPLKTEAEVMNLLEAATTQLGISIGKSLNIVELFAECEEGLEQKEFGREMCEQYRTAQRKYAGEIMQRVMELGLEEVDMATAKRVLFDVDPTLDEVHVEMHLRWLFGAKQDVDVERCGAIGVDVLASRLERGNLRRLKASDAGMKMSMVGEDGKTAQEHS